MQDSDETLTPESFDEEQEQEEKKQEQEEKKLSPVEEFIKEYRRDLYRLIDDARGMLFGCYNVLRKEVYPSPFDVIHDQLLALQTLCCIKEKMKAMSEAGTKCRQHFLNEAQSRGPLSENAEKALVEFEDKLREIENLVYGYQNDNIDKATQAYKEILDCRTGSGSNPQDHKRFQRKVMEFLDWLFINEMKRMDLDIIEPRPPGHLRSDGAFEVLSEFDTRIRCGFEFAHLFIECKNQKQPKYQALLQTFNYTLTCMDSRISQTPLSFLVSRENHSDDSVERRIRKILFKKRMEGETRLILFMDDQDLERMLNYKRGGDHASVLQEKVNDLRSRIIKDGGL